MAPRAALAIVAIALSGGIVLAADNDTYQSTNRNAGAQRSTAVRVDDWWWPFGRGEVRAARTPADAGKPQPTVIVAAEDVGLRRMTAKELAGQLDQTRDVFLRRLAVCDRIKQIADETGDKALEAQAEILQQRAMMLCQQRMNQLRLPGLAPESEAASEASLMADRKTQRPTSADARATPVRTIRRDQASSTEKE